MASRSAVERVLERYLEWRHLEGKATRARNKFRRELHEQDPGPTAFSKATRSSEWPLTVSGVAKHIAKAKVYADAQPTSEEVEAPLELWPSEPGG